VSIGVNCSWVYMLFSSPFKIRVRGHNLSVTVLHGFINVNRSSFSLELITV